MNFLIQAKNLTEKTKTQVTTSQLKKLETINKQW